MDAIRYELLDEADVTDEQRRLVGELLHEVFGARRALGRGWIRHRPLYRVLAWENDVLVGAEMGCRVACTPALDVYGIGDAAVREQARGRGIARTMGALIHEEAARRGAAAAVCNTGAVGLPLEHGMVRVSRGELYRKLRFRRRPLFVNWFIKWGTGTQPVVPLVLRERF